MNIANKLKEIYHGRIEIRPSISLPVSAYYAARKRYRADSLINYLGRRAGRGEVIIGLTHQDVSTTKGGNPDYGIMGLGLCPGNACVASTFRLKGVNIPEKLYKVSIHELGHTQGLRHCKVIGCLMRDAEGKDRLDQEHSFCVDCARVLKSKGWAF
jgi:archaemetzincin